MTLKSSTTTVDTSIVKGWKRALIHHGPKNIKRVVGFWGFPHFPRLLFPTTLKFKGFTENGVTIEDSTPRPSLTKLVYGILGKIN